MANLQKENITVEEGRFVPFPNGNIFVDFLAHVDKIELTPDARRVLVKLIGDVLPQNFRLNCYFGVEIKPLFGERWCRMPGLYESKKEVRQAICKSCKNPKLWFSRFRIVDVVELDYSWSRFCGKEA